MSKDTMTLESAPGGSAPAPHNKSNATKLSFVTDYEALLNGDGGEEAANDFVGKCLKLVYWTPGNKTDWEYDAYGGLVPHWYVLEPAIIPDSRCIKLKTSDGKVSIGPRKKFWAYQIVCFLKYGLAAMQQVPPAKQNHHLCISHLCGTRDCINPDHMVLESKQTNDERTSCHRCMMTGIANGQSLEQFWQFCAHMAGKCGSLPGPQLTNLCAAALPLTLLASVPRLPASRVAADTRAFHSLGKPIRASVPPPPLASPDASGGPAKKSRRRSASV
jgi:hypothetical protein